MTISIYAKVTYVFCKFKIKQRYLSNVLNLITFFYFKDDIHEKDSKSTPAKDHTIMEFLQVNKSFF